MCSFFGVNPRCLNFMCRRFETPCHFRLHISCKDFNTYENGTDRVFLNVGTRNSDAVPSPKRKTTTFPKGKILKSPTKSCQKLRNAWVGKVKGQHRPLGKVQGNPFISRKTCLAQRRARDASERGKVFVLGDLCWNILEALTGLLFDLNAVNKKCRENLILLCFYLTLDEV